MSEDTNNTQDNEIHSNVETLELYSDNYPFNLSLRISNFENETMYKKFIKNCEMLVRRCNEYKAWKNYIIDVLGMNECVITHEVMEEVTIEVHHHIPSLYVLVSALVNEKIENNKEFCSFDIATEAIELHFKNKIGYLTLLKSIHEKFHNGFLTIPINMVRGDYQYFIKNYAKYISDDDIDVINKRLSINESNCSWSRGIYSDVSNM